ncbi:MAG: outer membrane protein assembly factor BamB family protein, partial [Pirellulaceae bacterium]
GGAEVWDRFRGPNGSGLSDATTVPASWTENAYNWKVQLPGTGHSSPVVFGHHLFVTCADANTAERRIVCLNTADGSTVWRRDYPSRSLAQHPDNGYATATPAVDSRGVVVTWASAQEVVLLALTPDGTDMWRRELGPFIGPHGTGTSPLIVNDLVVLANEQEDYKALARAMGREDPNGLMGESFLIAVDRVTGETKWKVPRKSTLAPYSTPCLHRPENGSPELIFSSTSHGITAIDVASGNVNWEVADIFSDRCVGSPVTASGLIVAGYGHGTGGALCVAVRPGSQSPPREPSVAFEIKRSVPLVPTPLIVGERLFLWADSGVVTCLELPTGNLIWRERVAGDFFGSPVCIGNRLYCIAKNGDVVVLAASDTFQELARVSLGEPSFATPAVADGVMYLRTASHLYSLGGQRR